MTDPNRGRTVLLADLARELGVDYRTLRGWMNRRYPRASSDVYRSWELDPEQVEAVCDHVSGRAPRTIASPRVIGDANPDFITDWFWEGNVVASLARALVVDGWTIKRMADAGRREQGVDIAAVSGHRTLMVEVKGYPTTTYTRGPKSGQPKPTLPVSQARQWFSHAMLECLLMRSKYPEAEVAMAFPTMDTYLRLVERVRPSLVRLGFGVYVVADDGSARLLLAPERQRS